MINQVTIQTYLGSICNNSDPSKGPYSTNKKLVEDFFLTNSDAGLANNARLDD
jgi:hypothetical protein